MGEENYDLERVVEEPAWYEIVGRMGGNISNSVYRGIEGVVKPVFNFAGNYLTGLSYTFIIPTANRLADECEIKHKDQEAIFSTGTKNHKMIAGVSGVFSSFAAYIVMVGYIGIPEEFKDKDLSDKLTYFIFLPFVTNALSFAYEKVRASYQKTKKEVAQEKLERIKINEPMNPISGLSYPTDDSLGGQLSDATANTKPILERLREDDSLESRVGSNNKQAESTTG